MGAYVNPQNESKEHFLEREAQEIQWDNKPTFEQVPEKYMLVVLVENSGFTAAGIAFSKREYEIMTDPNESRRRRLFLIEEKKLHRVSLELKSYIK